MLYDTGNVGNGLWQGKMGERMSGGHVHKKYSAESHIFENIMVEISAIAV